MTRPKPFGGWRLYLHLWHRHPRLCNVLYWRSASQKRHLARVEDVEAEAA